MSRPTALRGEEAPSREPLHSLGRLAACEASGERARGAVGPSEIGPKSPFSRPKMDVSTPKTARNPRFSPQKSSIFVVFRCFFHGFGASSGKDRVRSPPARCRRHWTSSCETSARSAVRPATRRGYRETQLGDPLYS